MPALPVATQRLWAFLLLHRGRPLARKHVAFTLWPDTDEDDALTNLRRQLHTLQRKLPKPEQGAPPWVVADRVTVQWSSGAEYWLDVAAFETACGPHLGGGGGTPAAAGEGLEAASDRERLQRGVGLYTADLLVDAYDAWILAERERLGRILDDALWRLVGMCAAEADPRGAAAAAAQLLARDPFREEAHRLVIGLRYLGGDRAAALRAFQECRRVLARDLDVEPMPKTVRLVEAIRCAEGPDVVASLLGAELPGASVLARAAAGRVPHNLPAPISSFVGREEELAEARRLIAANRLVTLVGPGGCGKSRLALELAGQLVAPAPGPGGGHGRGPMPACPDGVWWVDLSPVEDSHLVPKSVADVLKVREEAGADVTETLARAIGTKAMLLVLDNCEHLVGACAGLAEALLRAAPRLRVMATSREVIGVVGEAAWPVPPMGLPPEADGRGVGEAADYDAPRLFLERARLAAPGFA
ncbi:MAG: BTAD domain-containing putative transcriptional regulator, partial [Anaerolineae bacterium]